MKVDCIKICGLKFIKSADTLAISIQREDELWYNVIEASERESSHLVGVAVMAMAKKEKT